MFKGAFEPFDEFTESETDLNKFFDEYVPLSPMQYGLNRDSDKLWQCPGYEADTSMSLLITFLQSSAIFR